MVRGRGKEPGQRQSEHVGGGGGGPPGGPAGLVSTTRRVDWLARTSMGVADLSETVPIGGLRNSACSVADKQGANTQAELPKGPEVVSRPREASRKSEANPRLTAPPVARSQRPCTGGSAAWELRVIATTLPYARGLNSNMRPAFLILHHVLACSSCPYAIPPSYARPVQTDGRQPAS
ncbi:hypothetical protein ACJQWK_10141 [Exserohilum turcicum]